MDTRRPPQPVLSVPPSAPDAPEAPDQNALAQSGGRFRDDPFWDEMQDSIRRHRQEMDATY